MSIKLREKKLKNNKYSLYLDIYQKGKRKLEFLNLYVIKPAKKQLDKLKNKENYKIAETIRAQKEIILNTQNNGFNSIILQKTNFFEFASQICNKKLNNSTNRDYLAAVNHFKKYFKTDYLQIGNITSLDIENFKDYLTKSDLKEHTIHNYFAKLKTIFKEAVRNNLIQRDPTSDVKNIKLKQVLKTFLTTDEIQKLSDTECKNDEVKRAFLFGCNTGLRFSDLYNLTYDKINRDNLQLTQQKTNEAIYLPLNNNALNLLKNGKEPNQNNRVFKLFKDVGYCNKILKEWCKNAGINKNLTFHVSRHSFATNLLINRTDISVVSKLLGHTTLKHTLIYTKIVKNLKNTAVNSLPDIKI